MRLRTVACFALAAALLAACATRPVAPVSPCRGVVGRVYPAVQARPDPVGHDRRTFVAMVLPGEIPVPSLPAHRFRRIRAGFPGQAQIRDGDHLPLHPVRRAVTVREGIELLEIAEMMMRLLFHPMAYALLQGAVRTGEWSGWQAFAALDGQDTRHAIGDRYNHRDQFRRECRRVRRRLPHASGSFHAQPAGHFLNELPGDPAGPAAPRDGPFDRGGM